MNSALSILCLNCDFFDSGIAMIWKIMLIHQSHESQFRQFRTESKDPGVMNSGFSIVGAVCFRKCCEGCHAVDGVASGEFFALTLKGAGIIERPCFATPEGCKAVKSARPTPG